MSNQPRLGRPAHLVYRVEQLAGTTVFDLANADLVVIPDGMEHRYTARVRTHASRAGIGVIFESHIEALTEANGWRTCRADLALAL